MSGIMTGEQAQAMIRETSRMQAAIRTAERYIGLQYDTSPDWEYAERVAFGRDMSGFRVAVARCIEVIR